MRSGRGQGTGRTGGRQARGGNHHDLISSQPVVGQRHQQEEPSTDPGARGEQGGRTSAGRGHGRGGGRGHGRGQSDLAAKNNIYRGTQQQQDASPWRNSRAKLFFQERLRDDNDSIHQKTDEEIFQTSNGFTIALLVYSISDCVHFLICQHRPPCQVILLRVPQYQVCHCRTKRKRKTATANFRSSVQ